MEQGGYNKYNVSLDFRLLGNEGVGLREQGKKHEMVEVANPPKVVIPAKAGI